MKQHSGTMSARPLHSRNASVSVMQHNNSYKNDLNQTLNPNNIRPLPVHERENVFNEWGAVIKHQDEIDRELRRQQEEKMRERQKNYKLQLDLQYQEYLSKKKGSISELARKEEQVLKHHQKVLDDKMRLEDQKRSQLIDQQKNAAFQSLNEMSSMKKQQQSIRDMERQIYYDKMKRQEELENQRKIEEKEKQK